MLPAPQPVPKNQLAKLFLRRSLTMNGSAPPLRTFPPFLFGAFIVILSLFSSFPLLLCFLDISSFLLFSPLLFWVLSPDSFFRFAQPFELFLLEFICPIFMMVFSVTKFLLTDCLFCPLTLFLLQSLDSGFADFFSSFSFYLCSSATRCSPVFFPRASLCSLVIFKLLR